ncbi:trigger factor [Candidatus Gracilibacteria bacterium]|nr:trigger factor [Candidatus Gracilibacteria bacterium]
MAQNLKKISGSKISFQFSVEAEDIKRARKKVLDRLRRDVSLKGFRKGSAPDAMVVESVGEQRVSFESINEALEEKYLLFLKENKIQPVSAPDLKVGDWQKMPLEVKGEVEVFPEVDPGNYKKITMSASAVKVEEKEVDEVIENIMREAGLGKEVARAAQKGDLLKVDFSGADNKGNAVPNTDGKEVPFVLGSGQFLPDLEKACEGMKAGEEKKGIKVKFPSNYHSETMAGKTLLFTLKLHSVTEVSVDSLDEKGIEQITQRKKTKKEFREEVKGMVQRNKEDQEKKKQIGEYNEALLKTVKADLPASWITKEVEMRMHELKNSPQYKHDPEAFWKAIGKKEEDIKKQFAKDAEKNLLVFLALSKITELEGIELDKDEMKKAELLAQHRMSQGQAQNNDQEIQSVALQLRIDKYLEGVRLSKN